MANDLEAINDLMETVDATCDMEPLLRLLTHIKPLWDEVTQLRKQLDREMAANMAAREAYQTWGHENQQLRSQLAQLDTAIRLANRHIDRWPNEWNEKDAKVMRDALAALDASPVAATQPSDESGWLQREHEAREKFLARPDTD